MLMMDRKRNSSYLDGSKDTVEFNVPNEFPLKTDVDKSWVEIGETCEENEGIFEGTKPWLGKCATELDKGLTPKLNEGCEWVVERNGLITSPLEIPEGTIDWTAVGCCIVGVLKMTKWWIYENKCFFKHSESRKNNIQELHNPARRSVPGRELANKVLSNQSDS